MYVYLCVCVYAHMYMYVMMPEWRSEDDLYEYVCVSTMCIPGIEFRLPVLVVSAVAGGAILMAPVMRFFLNQLWKETENWENSNITSSDPKLLVLILCNSFLLSEMDYGSSDEASFLV